MAFFFKYDKLKNEHTFYVFEKKDKYHIIGYKPICYRYDAKKSSIAEYMNDVYPELNDIFSTKKGAWDFAVDFFINLTEEKNQLK